MLDSLPKFPRVVGMLVAGLGLTAALLQPGRALAEEKKNTMLHTNVSQLGEARTIANEAIKAYDQAEDKAKEAAARGRSIQANADRLEAGKKKPKPDEAMQAGQRQ